MEDDEEFIQNWIDLEERLKAPEGQFKLIEIDKYSQPFASSIVKVTVQQTLRSMTTELQPPELCQSSSLRTHFQVFFKLFFQQFFCYILFFSTEKL